jgi:uncharacterized protein with FMN-binding domain
MRRAALAILGTIAGLVGLLSFKTHAAPVASQIVATSTTDPGATTSGGTGSGASAATPSTPSTPESSQSPSSPSTSPSSSSATTKAATTKTVTGDSVDTRWGPVQVKITVTNAKVTAVTAVVYPTENPRDQQINAYAIPALNQEALAASSAKIDMVSGATYTSQGYIGSLQSALDKAGL